MGLDLFRPIHTGSEPKSDLFGAGMFVPVLEAEVSLPKSKAIRWMGLSIGLVSVLYGQGWAAISFTTGTTCLYGQCFLVFRSSQALEGRGELTGFATETARTRFSHVPLG